MKLVGVREAAEILDLNPATVRLRIKSGAWPSYDLGERSVRVDVDEVLRLATKTERSTEAVVQAQ